MRTDQLRHGDDERHLSHQRRLAAHVRPRDDDDACARGAWRRLVVATSTVVLATDDAQLQAKLRETKNTQMHYYKYTVMT